MKTKYRMELVTIKITHKAARNFRIASGISGKKQYEITEEASNMMFSKYMAKVRKVPSS